MVGQSVTFTATVTSGGNPVTTGTVDFTEGATTLAAGVALNGSGQATFTTSALTAGSHPITATYSGTAALATSSGAVTQVVLKVGHLHRGDVVAEPVDRGPVGDVHRHGHQRRQPGHHRHRRLHRRGDDAWPPTSPSTAPARPRSRRRR